MKEPTREFYRKSVEILTGGDVAWVETISVPKSWWQANPLAPEGNTNFLNMDLIHVFNIVRSKEQLENNTKGFIWMGESGTAYVWAYCRNERWYYTRVFHNPAKGISSPEDAFNHARRSSNYSK